MPATLEQKSKVHSADLDGGRANLLNDRCSSRKLPRSTTASYLGNLLNEEEEEAQRRCASNEEEGAGRRTRKKKQEDEEAERRRRELIRKKKQKRKGGEGERGFIFFFKLMKGIMAFSQ